MKKIILLFLSLLTYGAFAQIEVKTNGDVGIGTTPTAKLDVNGTARISGNLGVGTSGSFSKISFGFSDANVNSRIAFYEHTDDGSRFRGIGMAFPDPVNYLYGVGIWSLTGSNGIPTDTNMNMFIGDDGNVGIGTWNTFGYKLAVNGNLGVDGDIDLSTSVDGNQNFNWPDYVFEKDYKLLTLDQVEEHIEEKGHLPNIPSAKEVEEKGSFSLGEMNKKLLEKVEELTLYTIAQEKKIKKLQKQETRIQKLEKENKQLKSILERISQLEAKLKNR